MSKNNPTARPEARLAKGFRDIEAAELKGLNEMLQTIRSVYECYGFDALETPAIEYTDALGKFLPDQDRPNAGVFSFQDVLPEAGKQGALPEAGKQGALPEAGKQGALPEAGEQATAEQWLSLRYDLTAPLARYVAQNFDKLPKPFRRYAFGSVYRNEKPGPGRFKQFLQFDADTVGAESVAADAEMCMLAADTLEALGLKGKYVIKVNNRKILDGVMEAAGLSGDANAARRLTVLRAIDKLDRLGVEGVRQLLGPGRKDESGDFTKGTGLDGDMIASILDVVAGESEAWVSYRDRASLPTGDEMVRKGRELFAHKGDEGRSAWDQDFVPDQDALLEIWSRRLTNSETGMQGVMELRQMLDLFRSVGYGTKRVQLTSTVVRGLEYYTGPVFEAELTFEVKGDDGKPVRFGSVGGGGRYDDLVARFTGQKVPATGFSIGVSRLQAALALIGEKPAPALGPVVVLVMDKAEIAAYQKMVQQLRNAGIRAEMYLGSSGMKAQMKYADKRNSPCVVIQGSDERAKGEVTIKDLIEGAKAAAAIKDNAEWKAARPAQLAVPEAKLVDEVRKIIARHQ